MSAKLTEGSLLSICQGSNPDKPILQIVGYKRIAGSSSDRYRLLVSDGKYSNSFAMLATQMNDKIDDGQIDNYTIIRVNKYVCNNMQGKKVIIFLDVDVLTPGSKVGEKIGNPVAINPDGSINDSPGTHVKQKRSAEETSMTEAPPSKKTSEISKMPRSSILEPRSYSSNNSSSSQSVQPIASLTPYQNKWTIKARVTQKSDIRRWSNSRGEGHLFSMDLLDSSGEIKATAFKDQCDKFYNMVEIDKVYYITNCQLKAANKQYSTLNNDYEMTFKDSTEMTLCSDKDKNDVPSLLFEFVKINQLANAEKDAIVDIIAIVKLAHEAVTIVSSRTQKELRKRELIIMDQSLTEVSFTIWGTAADTFDASNNPVIAIKGAKVSHFNGVSISALNSSTIQINPDIVQAHTLKGWYDSEGLTASSTSLTVAGGGSAQLGDIHGSTTKTLGEVKQENLGYGSEKFEYYSTRCTISMFQKEKALYQGCTQTVGGKPCNKKIIDNNGSYRCEKCNADNEDFNWRLILSFSITDFTDNQWVNCFQEQGEAILGISAQELGNYYQHDMDRYNRVFTEATFKQYNFRMRCKSDNYNEENRVRHTVLSSSPIVWEEQNKRIFQALQESGIVLDSKIDIQKYL